MSTGSSTCALACYLFKHGQLPNRQLQKLLFEQEYSPGRPSHIAVSQKVKGQKITRAQVGWRAIITGIKVR
jgi:predicted PhzF superfamily epimerase YddE/YHI9